MSDEYQDPRNLIVNYVPSPVSDKELRELFAQFGPVQTARVIVDPTTKTSKGYGFVKFRTIEGSQRAMTALNGFAIYNKRLKVSVARGPDHAGEGNQPVPAKPAPPAYVPPQMMNVPMYYPQMNMPLSPMTPMASMAPMAGMAPMGQMAPMNSMAPMMSGMAPVNYPVPTHMQGMQAMPQIPMPMGFGALPMFDMTPIPAMSPNISNFETMGHSMTPGSMMHQFSFNTSGWNGNHQDSMLFDKTNVTNVSSSISISAPTTSTT